MTDDLIHRLLVPEIGVEKVLEISFQDHKKSDNKGVLQKVLLIQNFDEGVLFGLGGRSQVSLMNLIGGIKRVRK